MEVMKIIDDILTFVFTAEMSLKIIAKGFIMCGPDSYIRSYWNILDFIVVVTSLVAFQFNS